MNSNGYIFTTRRQILARVSEPAFAVECVRILDAGVRWMASHRARAAKLMARLAAGPPTAADYAEASALAGRYGKTLARVFRERELVARPDLAAQAAVFGVARSQTEPVLAGATVAPREAVSADGPDPPVAPAAPKKRGRPKGSKNQVRAASEPRRRKRS